MLPPIHKLAFSRFGGGENSFEVTASKNGYLLLLKSSNFRTINRQYNIFSPVLIAKFDKLFKNSNPYKHFGNYHDNPTGTWQSWTFYDQAGEVLLHMDDQEYADGLDLQGIEWTVRQIVEDANNKISDRPDRCERLVSREMCEATDGCSWHANSPWPKCKD